MATRVLRLRSAHLADDHSIALQPQRGLKPFRRRTRKERRRSVARAPLKADEYGCVWASEQHQHLWGAAARCEVRMR